MRDPTRCSTIVWLGTLAGVSFWFANWVAPLVSTAGPSESVLAMLSRGAFTMPLYVPALLGLYILNTGLPLRCGRTRGAYAVYVAVLAVTSLHVGPFADPGPDYGFAFEVAISLSSAASVVIGQQIYTMREKRIRQRIA